MLPGGNSEIVGMLPSGCRRKLRNGNATRRKLWNCGNVTKLQAETPKLWKCYQAGGGNSEIGKYCAKMGSRCPVESPQLRECCADSGNVTKRVPCGNSDSVATCEKSTRNLPHLKFVTLFFALHLILQLISIIILATTFYFPSFFFSIHLCLPTSSIY